MMVWLFELRESGPIRPGKEIDERLIIPRTVPDASAIYHGEAERAGVGG